jgi:uracil-DNA glycosylase family 4
MAQTPIDGELPQKAELLITALLTGSKRTFSLTYKNTLFVQPVLPGHLWNYNPQGVNISGVQPASVMVVNKLLYEEDIKAGGVLWGASGLDFANELFRNNLDPTNWYVTNFVKCLHPDSVSGNSTILANMAAEFKPILLREISAVNPDVIICLGTEAATAVLGTKVTLKQIEETVQQITIPTREKPIDVIGIPHPHAAKYSGNSRGNDNVTIGIRFLSAYFNPEARKPPIKKDYRIIKTVHEYKQLAKEIQRTCEDNLIAVDAEWNGEHPQNANAYLRCFQLSWKPNTAACIVLGLQTHDSRVAMPCFYDDADRKEICKITKQILKGRAVAGHFIEADMEYLQAFGLDLQPFFEVPDTPEAYRKAWLNKEACGFDTGRAIHAVDESADFSLKTQALINTSAGKYDRELDEWIKEHTSPSNPPPEGKLYLDGYGIVPDYLLFHYACYDADVTRELALQCTAKLDSDVYGNNCWRPYWIAMRCLPAILEINTTGLKIDRQRLQLLTDQYQEKATTLLNEVREWAKWDTFNPHSCFQMRELLFGEKYNGKTWTQTAIKRWYAEHKDQPDEQYPEYIRLRPRIARSMELTPLLTTGKYPQKWETIKAAHQERLHAPSVNKKVIAQLAYFHSSRIVHHHGCDYKLEYKPILEKLQQLNVISQTLRYVLKPPTDNDAEVEAEASPDDDSMPSYDGGIPSFICDDGRVRTHIYPTKTTGRWSSARPSMQNLGKLVEESLKETLQDDYHYPLRSIFIPEDGHVFIEADYVGAEIAAAAFMCDDPHLIDHCDRNQLPEDDPNYYDIHSHIAVQAFRLECEPSKKGLASINKGYLRNISKKVLFGLFYGRGPESIVEEIKSQGILITYDEARQIITAISEIYPRLLPYFDACEQRIIETGWIANAFGRYRRFPKTFDQQQTARFGRQGKNFPIQSLVADVVNTAAYHLKKMRDQLKLKAKIVLSIHDAILMEVPLNEVSIVCTTLLPNAMVKSVPIIPSDLEGRPLPNHSPKYLGIDIEVYSAFGVKAKAE